MSKFIACALCGHRWPAASGVRFGRFPGERFWPVSWGAVLAGFRGSGLARFRGPGSGSLRAGSACSGRLASFDSGPGWNLIRRSGRARMRRGFGCSGGIRGSGGFGCALRPRRSGAGPRGVPHSVRAVPSSPLWPRKSFDGHLGSFGSGPGWNLIRWFWWLRMCRRFRLFGRFRLLRGPVVREAPVACRGFVRRLPALLSSGPHLGGTGGFSLLRAARLALRGLRLDKSSEKARTGLNYS